MGRLYYREELREKMPLIFGEMPERTPLNVRVTDEVDRGSYIVRNIIFDSRPDFPMTANVYVPRNADFPAPAVIIPSGHSREAKGVGYNQAAAQVLARNYRTLDDLMEAPEEDLQAIEGIGPEVARSVVTFFEGDQNSAVIRHIREAGLSLENPHYSGEEAEQPLDDLKFVFTGSLDRWTRDEVKRYVERLGARATSSVSGETDYVVAGPGAGSKLDEAQEHGVPVMDEQEFVEFVEERS